MWLCQLPFVLGKLKDETVLSNFYPNLKCNCLSVSCKSLSSITFYLPQSRYWGLVSWFGAPKFVAKPWNAPIAIEEMLLSAKCNSLPLLFPPVHHFFSCIYLSFPHTLLLHPPFVPAGEVVTCPEGTWGTPPSCSCVEDNTAYFGNNARVGSSNPQPSRAACARSCREHPECQFWTWGKGSPMGPCYLKHSRDNVSPGLTSYVSGSKLCVLPESEGKPDELYKSAKIG